MDSVVANYFFVFSIFNLPKYVLFINRNLYTSQKKIFRVCRLCVKQFSLLHICSFDSVKPFQILCARKWLNLTTFLYQSHIMLLLQYTITVSSSAWSSLIYCLLVYLMSYLVVLATFLNACVFESICLRTVLKLSKDFITVNRQVQGHLCNVLYILWLD